MTREEKMAQAGEYALGLLDAAERAAFETRMQADPELAAMTDKLVEHLQHLDDTAAGVADPGGWDAIAARIGATAQLPRNAANDNVRLPRWAAMAASLLLAVGLGFLLGRSSAPQGPKPTVVAVLINEADQSPGAIVEVFGSDVVHLVPLERFSVPSGSVLQIWTLPDAASGPVSLGTLSAPRDVQLKSPELPIPSEGQLYEITVEPAPGSPTGKPTGPILVKGYAKVPI